MIPPWRGRLEIEQPHAWRHKCQIVSSRKQYLPSHREVKGYFILILSITADFFGQLGHCVTIKTFAVLKCSDADIGPMPWALTYAQHRPVRHGSFGELPPVEQSSCFRD